METDDFAATTRIGNGPEASTSSASRAVVAGPSFAAPAALEKYLLQAKGLKGAGAAKLIEQATSDKAVFVFAELADVPNVAELAKSEQFASHYRLLQLFAFHTWKHYQENKASYPELNSPQAQKLKQLSLITIAAKTRQLPYALLLELLDITEVRKLEDLVIETIYAGLLKGRLDQRRQRLDVEWIVGRDVDHDKVKLLAKDLTDWCKQIRQTIGLLDQEINHVKDKEQRRAAEQDRHLVTVNKLIAEIGTKGKSGGGRGGAAAAAAAAAPEDEEWSRNSPKKGEAREDVMDVDGDDPGKKGPARGGRKRARA